MSTTPEPDDFDRMRDEIRDGLRPHPSHPAWYQPPFPHPPTVCEACGTFQTDEAAGLPCDPQEPPDEPYTGPSARETHAAAWQQHQETHR